MKQFVSPASWCCSDFTIIFHSLVAVSTRKMVGNYQYSREIVTSLQNVLTGTLGLQGVVQREGSAAGRDLCLIVHLHEFYRVYAGDGLHLMNRFSKLLRAQGEKPLYCGFIIFFLE